MEQRKAKKKGKPKSGNLREKSEESGGSLAERRKKLLAMQMEKEGSARSVRRATGPRYGDNSRNTARAIPPPRTRSYSSSSSSTSSYRSTNSASSLRNKSPQGSSWDDWTPKKASTPSAHLGRTSRLPLTTNRKAQYGERSATRSKRPVTRTRAAIRDPPPSRASQQRRKELHGDPSASTAPPQVDSTLFFPVGTSVVHTVHGEGKVLPPPKAAQGGDMLVRVEFENGIEMELPVGGGLRHKF